MDFSLTPQEAAFAEEVRTWLEERLVGDFATLRGMGGTGQEDIAPRTAHRLGKGTRPRRLARAGLPPRNWVGGKPP